MTPKDIGDAESFVDDYKLVGSKTPSIDYEDAEMSAAMMLPWRCNEMLSWGTRS